MAIDASQRLDRFDLIDVQMPAMFGRDVAAVMRQGHRVLLPIALLPPQLAARAGEAGIDGNVVDEIRVGLTDAERQSQKGA